MTTFVATITTVLTLTLIRARPVVVSSFVPAPARLYHTHYWHAVSESSSGLPGSTAITHRSSTEIGYSRDTSTDRIDKRDINMEFIEIGGNLLDNMYKGVYRGKERHPADLDDVLQRAFDPPDDANHSVQKIVVTAGSLSESREALEFARSTDGLYSTVGVHPTRCNEFMDEKLGELNAAHVDNLIQVCQDGMADGTVRAIGELGLDYARTQFCSVDVQKAGFLAQLRVAEETKLPLFLHNRDTGTDLLDLLKENRQRFTRGVVHSFDDTAELARAFLDLDLYIGINGCSLKTAENLEVVKYLPLDRLLLETDCPWCDIRASHAGFEYVKTKYPTKQEKKYEKGCCVKGRNEPCHIIQVAEVVAGVKGLPVEEVAAVCYRNSMIFFGFD